MSLRRVQVTDFRCLQSTDLGIDPDFTLISGANASGKTSLLEAIYVLGRGRSFRTRRLEQLIRQGHGRFAVLGEVQTAHRVVGLGIEGTLSGIRARVGASKVASLAELALQLPVQIIDPEVHRLIEEGPPARRRFLDWGVFHVEPTFVEQWQRYQQALRQRNAALKTRQLREVITAWDAELVRYGDAIDSARRRYLERLSPEVLPLAGRLLEGELSLSYRPGWNAETTLAEALQRGFV